MIFNPPLQVGALIRRYKRFLADIEVHQQTITIHCPNTGAMTGCAEPGQLVFYSTSNNPKRKYPNTWELSRNQQGEWFCVNTMRANAILHEAITQQQIPELLGYDTIRCEVKYGNENSKIDLLLQGSDQSDCYIEIKSVTLKHPNNHQGYFPDAQSIRGQKHLRELTNMAKKGKRAVLFFLCQHTGIEKISPAHHIDQAYGKLLDLAMQQGVEVLCYGTQINQKQIVINRQIEFNNHFNISDMLD